jgi:CubicO group peptidase (beta-lactamase class C family)
MLEIIRNLESDVEPDTKTSYSNSNFMLLTYMLERVYQKSFAEILDEKIVIPIGLKNTFLGNIINTKNNECNSYTFWEGSWIKEPETNISLVLGTGGIVSTPVDLPLFSDALFSGKLISQNSLEQMKTFKDRCEATKLVYGMGLISMPFEDRASFGHLGGIDGFRTMFTHFPESDISLAFSSNGGPRDDIATVLFRAIFNLPFEIPEYKTYYVADEELDKYLGVYSREQTPIRITITKDNGKLFMQLTGQPSFPLEAIEQDKFIFEPTNLILEFNPIDNTLVLKQSGGVFNFVRED